jgi:hypothetical protein
MQYSYYARQAIVDNIYSTRLRLIYNLPFDIKKTAKRYSYFMKAALGRLYC